MSEQSKIPKKIVKDNRAPVSSDQGLFMQDNRPTFAAQRQMVQLMQNANNTVRQRAITEYEVSGADKKKIDTFIDALDDAVQKAWASILATPTLGAFADIDGYTQLWVKKITEYAFTRKAPRGLHTAFGYAVESLVSKVLCPTPPSGIQVLTQTTEGSTRPDLELVKDKQVIAWLDITAHASRGHIRAKAGGWTQAPNLAEVTYPSIGASDLLDMAKRVAENPKKDIDLGVNPADFKANALRAKAELDIKLNMVRDVLIPLLQNVKKIKRIFPDLEKRKRFETMVLLQPIFGENISYKQVACILEAVNINASTYGFGTGFSTNSATGVMLIQDTPDEEILAHKGEVGPRRRAPKEMDDLRRGNSQLRKERMARKKVKEIKAKRQKAMMNRRKQVQKKSQI